MDINVKPKEWILDNRIGYGKKTYETFNRERYPETKKTEKCSCENGECDIDIKTISLFPHQKILRDYMQFDSPYRGILAYHELGSGKSAASIAAAEGFIEKRNIFVLTPASLAKNYENELMKISKIGLNMKKSWTLLKIKKKEYSKYLIDKLEEYGIKTKFIKSDKLVWIPLYKNDIEKEEVEIIKKDVGYKSKEISDNEKNKIDDTILHIIRNRYRFISYNGLTQKMIKEMGKDIFNDSFIIVDEVHNFISRIVNGSKIAREVYNKIMDAINCKLVLLSGTPIINNPYEIATLINLLRGPMKIHKLKLLDKSVDVTNKEILKELENTEYIKYIDYVYIKDRTINVALLPLGYKKKIESIEILKEEWEKDENKIIKEIIEKINKKKEIKISKIVKNELYYALPNEKEEFNKLFINNEDIEEPKLQNLDLFQRRILGTVSYYRTSGSEYFPKLLPIKIKYLTLTNHQLSIYDEVRERERKIDEIGKFKNRGKGGYNGVVEDTSSVYRAFSRMVCNFAFPKEIKRVYPQDIRKLLKKELDDQIEEENDIEKENVKEKDKIKEKSVVEYDEKINEALKELDNSDMNYLSRENLKENYSPKYSKMLEDIEESPGTVLIYSQFRSVEGLGIFMKVLDKEEYKQIVLVKKDNKYEFEDLSIFDIKYDNKRYVVFNSDREKTNQLMHLYNGDYDLLDQNLYESLPDRIKSDKKIQLKGKIAKIMMITQSGAEGISLKNVRRVLIMEYFWNSVRINQVIGRAVRTCSHELLDKEERNVEVICYLMKLSEEQLKKNFTIKTLDNGLTTDEFIFNKATKKEKIINEFLKLLKASSFDCVINSKINKPLESGYKCYNWPINVDNKKLSYTKNIKEDNKILQHDKYKKLKKDKGIIVMIKNKKYVELNKKLYDYNSYKNAGILVEIK